MGRSGYDDEYFDQQQFAVYRGVIASATRGKRGQVFFRDLVAALDAMPVKRLIADQLEATDGEVCALGALGKRKGLRTFGVDTEDTRALGGMFNIAQQLAAETMYVNDERGPSRGETDEERWTRVRKWAAEQIRVTPEELLPGPAVPSGGDGERETKET